MIKTNHLKMIIPLLMLGSAFSSHANDAKFKIATVSYDANQQAYISNDFSSKSKRVKQANKDTYRHAFNKYMKLCATTIKNEQIEESEFPCNEAIKNVELIKTQSSDIQYLKSLSYSNRGVSKYIKGNLSGAMNDLITAILIDSNTVTKNNLTLIKVRSAEINPVITENVTMSSAD